MACKGNIDPLKICPYFSNHRVASRRFLAHIAKCEKDPKAPQLLKCQFDSAHRIAPELYQAHLIECPASRSIIREMLSSSERPDYTVNGSKAKNEPCESSDPWAEEAKAEGYKRPDFLLSGLDSDNLKVTRRDGSINPIALQAAKPAERRKVYEEMAERRLASSSDIKSEYGPPIKREKKGDHSGDQDDKPRPIRGIGRGQNSSRGIGRGVAPDPPRPTSFKSE